MPSLESVHSVLLSVFCFGFPFPFRLGYEEGVANMLLVNHVNLHFFCLSICFCQIEAFLRINVFLDLFLFAFCL